MMKDIRVLVGRKIERVVLSDDGYIWLWLDDNRGAVQVKLDSFFDEDGMYFDISGLD
jgi:hypothetical protein